MLVNISSSSFRSLLLFLVVSVQLAVAVTVAASEPVALDEREESGFPIPLKRNNIWERADRTPEENLEAQTRHMKGKYRQSFLAYHNNTGHRSPQMNVRVSIATLEARALEERDANALAAHRRRNGKHERSWLGKRAGSKATVPLSPTDNYVLWEGDIKLGTPSQTVSVDFDTGSADFVLNMGQYDADKSSSGKNTKKRFEVNYADGTGETGFIYNETVRVGKSIAKGQAVGVPTWSSFGEDEPGLVGLAFQSISTMNRRPLVQTLFAQGSIPKAMVGVSLLRSSVGSEMQLGGFHRAKIADGASLQWRDIDSSGGFWVLNDLDISMSRTYKGKTSSASVKGRSAIMDTGTTLIYGPTADVKALYEGAGVSTVTHGSSTYGIYKKTPDISFTIGSKTYPVKDAAVTFTTTEKGYKYGTIVGTDDLGLADGQWLIGGPWFSTLYTVFDFTGKRIGFAPASY